MSDLDLVRDLLHDVREGGTYIIGLGGNVQGVECFRSTPAGVRVQVLATVEGDVVTVSVCPLPPLGCGPDAAAAWHDAHDHTTDDVIVTGGSVEDVPAQVVVALAEHAALAAK